MSAMPRKRRLAVKASPVAMGQERSSATPDIGHSLPRAALKGRLLFRHSMMLTTPSAMTPRPTERVISTKPIVAAAGEAMSPFDDTDAPLASGASRSRKSDPDGLVR